MAATIRSLAPALGLVLAGCDAGDVVLLAPETNGGSSTLSIHAVIDTPYVPLATALGWSAGVPGARVRVHLISEPYGDSYWRVAATDSAGLARFPGLLGGLYEVEVSRVLTEPETARSGARVLAGGRRIAATANAVEGVTLAPDQRGSLVFSEFGLAVPLPWETAGEYPDVKYFEIYNNSDTTIYLDGKYWGIGWDKNLDYAAWPCAQTAIVRNDPEGIWVNRIFRFPGAGREHPLPPGGTAVVAKSAIDHREIYPFLYDLSHADFEWGGYRNGDNPDVPNLEDIGPRPMALNWPLAIHPEFLSEPIDLAALPRYTDPWSGYQYVRVPGTHILDASVGRSDFTESGYLPQPSCLEDTHRFFERLPGPAEDRSVFRDGLSFQRRVLRVLPDGRNLLQDTNTSMFDFVKAPRTPGWIPDP